MFVDSSDFFLLARGYLPLYIIYILSLVGGGGVGVGVGVGVGGGGGREWLW